MAAGWKILFAVGFSLVTTLTVMLIVSQLPGMGDVPTGWWLVGLVLPIFISAPISLVLVRQSESISRLNAELTRAYADMKRVSETDHLTGVQNRAAFEARIVALQARRPGWFLVVDIDHFKAINDSHGHAFGDAALVAVTNALTAVTGPDDIVARIGGEEFAIYLPVASNAAALWLGEQIRQRVADLQLADADGQPIALTVSIGVAGGRGFTAFTGLQAADRAMYRAKEAGRDRVQLDS